MARNTRQSRSGQRLVATSAMKGRSCSAYHAVAPEVRSAGGRYVEIGVNDAHLDWMLVTAPAWPAPPKWPEAFLGDLGTRLEA
jgi:protease I